MRKILLTVYEPGSHICFVLSFGYSVPDIFIFRLSIPLPFGSSAIDREGKKNEQEKVARMKDGLKEKRAFE